MLENLKQDPNKVKKEKQAESIYHQINGKKPYENIIDFKTIIATPQPSNNNINDITINYIAKEPGFYRIAFSNEHSWMTKKVVLFRYCVLVPVDQKEQKEYIDKNILGIKEKKTEETPIVESKNLMDMLDDEPERRGDDPDLLLLTESLGL